MPQNTNNDENLKIETEPEKNNKNSKPVFVFVIILCVIFLVPIINYFKMYTKIELEKQSKSNFIECLTKYLSKPSKSVLMVSSLNRLTSKEKYGMDNIKIIIEKHIKDGLKFSIIIHGITQVEKDIYENYCTEAKPEECVQKYKTYEWVLKLAKQGKIELYIYGNPYLKDFYVVDNKRFYEVDSVFSNKGLLAISAHSKFNQFVADDLIEKYNDLRIKSELFIFLLKDS